MTPSSISWQLQLLGTPVLSREGGWAQRLDGKPALLLAYLALEGPTSRRQLARLLWPDAAPTTARNSLAQLLHRFHSATGAPVVEGQAVLSLVPDLRVDVQAPGQPFEPLLLTDLTVDGCPDLMDWLLAQRETRAGLQNDVLRAEIERQIQAGDLHAALELATTHVERDPLSEEAHRQLMNLHYLNGDRAAALRAYQRLKTLLHEEFGATPAAATVQLAQDIERTAPQLPTPIRSGIPLSVLRPPSLVERDALWSALETAWAEGVGIALTGASGIGKTRLAMDFLRSKPDHYVLVLQGCPGDQAAAYSTHARTYRQTLEAFPDLTASLPAWVRRELARMIPSLGDAPPPMASDAEKLRFYDAKVEVLIRVAQRHPVVILSDDLQFMDDASIEAGAYVYSKFWGRDEAPLRSMFCYREGELSPATTVLAQQLSDSGVVRFFHLEPLSVQAVERLLGDVGVPDPADLAGEVHRLTQGNPQVTLEVVKAFYQQGDFSRNAVKCAASGTVGSLMAGRFTRLTPGALHAARAAAVLRSDFTLELVADVLRCSLLDLLAAWNELEQAQFVHGERFVHDLVPEVILGSTPAPVIQLLHRMAARVLVQHGGAPARIAGHLTESGERQAAGPWWARAAEQALGVRDVPAAASFSRKAALAYELAGQPELAHTLRAQAERLAPP